jgi:CheY-like chemotaxis protein
VTGKVMAGERKRCIDAGASDYVPKPIDTGELLLALQQWLPVTATADAVADADAAVTPSPFPEAQQSVPVVVLDGADSSAQGPEEGPLSAPIDEPTGPKILVIDDDFRNTFALSALLERGHQVFMADSGIEALKELERTPDVDVVLMDIAMPVMDGYETIRAIRTIESFKNLPIIALTGKVMPGERQRSIDAGASDYIPKPLDSAELFAALRPWIPPTPQPAAA